MAFLNGFLRGTFGNDEAREHNIKTAVSICRKIEFKYMEKPEGKANLGKMLGKTKALTL